MLYFIRDDVDDLLGFNYNNMDFYYIKNFRNDIISIINENGNILVTYEYDSWGNILSIKDNFGVDVSKQQNHIGNINPFRYRSYYYDREMELYYINTRYYNPKWRRFISADGTINLESDEVSYNLYVYAENDPINYLDDNGNSWISSLFKLCTNIYNKFFKKKKSKSNGEQKKSNKKESNKSGTSSNKNNNNKKNSSSNNSKTSTTSKKAITYGTNNKSQTVYILTEPKTNTVFYIGRTVNPAKCELDHLNSINRSTLEFNGNRFKTLTYEEARGLEQSLILRYKTLNKGNPANNQINGVRWDNPKCSTYMRAALKYLEPGESYVDYCKK